MWYCAQHVIRQKTLSHLPLSSKIRQLSCGKVIHSCWVVVAAAVATVLQRTMLQLLPPPPPCTNLPIIHHHCMHTLLTLLLLRHWRRRIIYCVVTFRRFCNGIVNQLFYCLRSQFVTTGTDFTFHIIQVSSLYNSLFSYSWNKFITLVIIIEKVIIFFIFYISYQIFDQRRLWPPKSISTFVDFVKIKRYIIVTRRLSCFSYWLCYYLFVFIVYGEHIFFLWWKGILLCVVIQHRIKEVVKVLKKKIHGNTKYRICLYNCYMQ